MNNLSKNICWSILIVFFVATEGFSQGELSEEAHIFYRNERTYAGQLYSNGWGLNMGFTKRKDAFRSNTFGFGFSSIHHPKEYKSQSPYTQGWGRSYVFGKMNEALAIRVNVGKQKEIFSKYDKGGIAIRYYYSGGISLALLKPIYYQKIVSIDYETGKIVYDASLFDPDYMQSVYDIYDRESFFVGLNETKLNPGVFARAGLSFEYSAAEETINALEIGLQMEGFLKELQVMAVNTNQRFFLSLFVGYRFGKVSN